jgi:hypothetical protein
MINKTGETKMTNITFTEKEELVLQVCLDGHLSQTLFHLVTLLRTKD